MAEPPAIRWRLGLCEVCGNNAAKYTCPACQVKTCSLPCINIHKKELECTGVRNKVQFKQLQKFTDMDLHSDYCLLEEIGRSVDRVSKTRRTYQKNMALKWLKLKTHMWKKGTRLDLLPPQFTRHETNTSYLNWTTGVVSWKVEYIFPQADNFLIVDSRVDETSIVKDLIEAYTCRDRVRDIELADRLKPYLDSDVRVLIKVEKSNNDYLLVNTSLSLSECLEGKHIIEHPSFYIVLSTHLHLYNIVSAESVKINLNDSVKREGRHFTSMKPHRRGRGRGGGRGRVSRAGSARAGGSMKFFSDNLSDSD